VSIVHYWPALFALWPLPGWVARKVAAGRYPRRGGYMVLGRASARGNRAAVRRVRTYTACSTAGPLLVDTVQRGVLREPSRTTAPTGSGTNTTGNRGAAERPTIAQGDELLARQLRHVTDRLG
jgi:hypothetical protein